VRGQHQFEWWCSAGVAGRHCWCKSRIRVTRRSERSERSTSLPLPTSFIAVVHAGWSPTSVQGVHRSTLPPLQAPPHPTHPLRRRFVLHLPRGELAVLHLLLAQADRVDVHKQLTIHLHPSSVLPQLPLFFLLPRNARSPPSHLPRLCLHRSASHLRGGRSERGRGKRGSATREKGRRSVGGFSRTSGFWDFTSPSATMRWRS
jgi:hypothetical protein